MATENTRHTLGKERCIIGPIKPGFNYTIQDFSDLSHDDPLLDDIIAIANRRYEKYHNIVGKQPWSKEKWVDKFDLYNIRVTFENDLVHGTNIPVAYCMYSDPVRVGLRNTVLAGSMGATEVSKISYEVGLLFATLADLCVSNDIIMDIPFIEPEDDHPVRRMIVKKADSLGFLPVLSQNKQNRLLSSFSKNERIEGCAPMLYRGGASGEIVNAPYFLSNANEKRSLFLINNNNYWEIGMRYVLLQWSWVNDLPESTDPIYLNEARSVLENNMARYIDHLSAYSYPFGVYTRPKEAAMKEGMLRTYKESFGREYSVSPLAFLSHLSRAYL